MNNISYFAPGSLHEVLALLDSESDARILAGGTDIIVKWKKSNRPDMKLVDIGKIEELKVIDFLPGSVFIGAGVTMDHIADSGEIALAFPILAEAAGKVGSVQVRNRATIGGNCCNAAPSADTVLPLMVYGATAMIVSKHGEKECPVHKFFIAPGKTVLQKGEMLKGFVLPDAPQNSASFFIKHSRRAGMDLATVGVAVTVSVDQSRNISHIRGALGAVGPTPIMVEGLENFIGVNLHSENLNSRISGRSAQNASPITDVRGSKEYRNAMIIANTKICFDAIVSKLS